MAQNAGKVVTFSNNNQANMADSVTGSMGQGGGQSIRSYDQSNLAQNFGATQQSGANLDSTVVPAPGQQAAQAAQAAPAAPAAAAPVAPNDHVDCDQTEGVKDNDNLLENKSNGDEPQDLVGDALVATIGGDNELKVESGRDSPVNGLIYNEDDGDDAAAAYSQNSEAIVINKNVSPDYAEATVPMDDPSLLEADDDEVSVESQDLVKLEFGMKLENETFNESVKEKNVDNSQNDGNLVENANGNGNDKIAGNVSSKDQIGISGNGFLGAVGEGPWGSNSIGGQAIISDLINNNDINQAGGVAVADANGNISTANGNNGLSGLVGFAPWANDNEFKNFINNNNNNNNLYENDVPTPSFQSNPQFSLFEETPNGSQIRPVNENGGFNELFFKNMNISAEQKRELHVEVSPQTKHEMALNKNQTVLDADGKIKSKRQTQGRRTLSKFLEEFNDEFLAKLKKEGKKEDEDDNDNNNNDNAAV